MKVLDGGTKKVLIDNNNNTNKSYNLEVVYRQQNKKL